MCKWFNRLKVADPDQPADRSTLLHFSTSLNCSVIRLVLLPPFYYTSNPPYTEALKALKARRLLDHIVSVQSCSLSRYPFFFCSIFCSFAGEVVGSKKSDGLYYILHVEVVHSYDEIIKACRKYYGYRLAIARDKTTLDTMQEIFYNDAGESLRIVFCIVCYSILLRQHMTRIISKESKIHSHELKIKLFLFQH